ncbi:hypothetical protein [Streptomyces sp. NBC_01006]|uniref:hypothetical protein n=1 Tax=Streptomyces sp. NBC_01006 TaxID=2903716 RepID=UPI0038659315|nr:hypothetical protein OG509_04580 [Streptomyces sp. NBC_01006]
MDGRTGTPAEPETYDISEIAHVPYRQPRQDTAMLTLNEALEAARTHLEGAYAHEPRTIVLQPELSGEDPLAWIIRYEARPGPGAAGSPAAALTSVVLVPKDGSAVRFPPSHLPLDEYFAYVRHGGWASAALARTVKAEP